MSDKILSREDFKKSLFANSNGYSLLLEHDAALRADRDTWKARAEAQPDVIKGPVDALRGQYCNVCGYRLGFAGERFADELCDACVSARASLKAFEETKAKGGE